MTALDQIMAAVRSPAQSRTERFMARLETHLAGLPEDARAPFLQAQVEKWCADYSAWAHRIDSDTATPIDLACTAYDYIETIGVLEKRLRKLEREPERADA